MYDKLNNHFHVVSAQLVPHWRFNAPREKPESWLFTSGDTRAFVFSLQSSRSRTRLKKLENIHKLFCIQSFNTQVETFLLSSDFLQK